MKVALYARVSTDDKDQTPENQLVVLRNYSKVRGYESTEYVDYESGAVAERLDYQRMLKDARAHQFSTVIAVSVDRLGRDVIELHRLLEDLRAHNVNLIILEWGMDTSTDEGDLMFTIASGLAKIERKKLSRRTKAGMARAKEKGTKSGRPIGRPRNPASTEMLIALKNQGKSLSQIGAEVGMTKMGVCKRLKAYRKEREGST
jgi:DNA invertase Pin-like site-specific DNA recombinase